MKVLCVYLCNYKDRHDYFISLMPYGITSIASYLESQNHETVLANLSPLGYKKGVDTALQFQPDVVAISIFSYNRSESLKFIRELKKRDPGIIIVAGGHHPTFLADEILKRYPEIDYIIKGEGEISLNKLLEQLRTGKAEKIIQGDRIPDIDMLPYPSLFKGKSHGVNFNEQFKYIITSRGCPARCTYCSSPSFWGRKVTYRSSLNIIEELRHIRNKYGIIYFSIRDDNFTLNKKRVMEFCRLLEESRLYMMWNCQARVDTIDIDMLIAMKRAGLEHIQYGVESGSSRMLKLYDKSTSRDMVLRAAKLTRDAGINLSFYLMAGMHGETDSDIDDTVTLMRETQPHDSIVSPVAYYPGTAIYNKDREAGLVDDSIWFESGDSGVYLSDTVHTAKRIDRLLKENIKISSKSSYSLNDIKKHREITGDSCWMNNIFEGDIHFNSGNYLKADESYMRVTAKHPENIWGYLRLSESQLHCSVKKSIIALHRALDIAPANNEVLYRLAMNYKQAGDKKSALKYAELSYKLNPLDPDIAKLYSRLKP